MALLRDVAACDQWHCLPVDQFFFGASAVPVFPGFATRVFSGYGRGTERQAVACRSAQIQHRAAGRLSVSDAGYSAGGAVRSGVVEVGAVSTVACVVGWLRKDRKSTRLN